MPLWLAQGLVDGLSLYCGCGLAFALWLAARGLPRLDHAAAGGSWGFRLLILPGATLLWPLLLLRVLRGSAIVDASNDDAALARQRRGHRRWVLALAVCLPLTLAWALLSR